MRSLGVTRSYLVVAAVLVVAMASQTANQQWSTDWYHHAATVREISAHPLDPHHATLAIRADDADLTPYLWTLGIATRATGASVLTVTSIAAIVNLLAFLVALAWFVRCFSTRPQAPTWTLLFVLVLWGVSPWRWSGYLDLNSIGFGLPYPSMAAFVCVLFGLTLLHRWCLRPRIALLLGAAALGAATALIHPPTTVPAAVGAGAILVSQWRPELSARWWQLGAAAGFALTLIAIWPLYPWFSLLHHGGAYDADNRATYRLIPLRGFLLLVTLPALWLRWRRSRRDALVLLAAAGWMVFAIGGLTHHETLGRTMPFAALAGDIALADLIARRVEAGNRRVLFAGATAVVIGLAGCASVLPRFVPRQVLPAKIKDRDALRPLTSGYGFLAQVPANDVMAVESATARAPAATFGGKLFSPVYPEPFLRDAEARARDERQLFITRDPAIRAHRLRQYRVRWLLVGTGYAEDARHKALLALGRVVHRDRQLVLVHLPATIPHADPL